MSKEEFIEELKKIGFPGKEKIPEDDYMDIIDDKEYKLIEFVYTFHPSVSEVEGKAQVAWLYKNFGIRIFADMLYTAKKAEELDAEKRKASLKLQEVDNAIQKMMNPAIEI